MRTQKVYASAADQDRALDRQRIIHAAWAGLLSDRLPPPPAPMGGAPAPFPGAGMGGPPTLTASSAAPFPGAPGAPPAPSALGAPPPGARGMASLAPPPPPVGGGSMGGPPMGAPSLPPGAPPMPPAPALDLPTGGGAPVALAGGGTPTGPMDPALMKQDPLMADTLLPGEEMGGLGGMMGGGEAADPVLPAHKIVQLVRAARMQQEDDGPLPDEGVDMAPPPEQFVRWLTQGTAQDADMQDMLDEYRAEPTTAKAAELFEEMQMIADADPDSLPLELRTVPGLRPACPPEE